MKKVVVFLILFFYQIGVYALPKVNSPYIYFYNIDNEEVIYEKSSDKEIPIASLTKIMTAYIALELIDDLDAKVVMTSEDFKGLREEHAATAGFQIGEEVTYRDLLYGLFLPSGAECALGLANHLAGSEKKFVAKMNEKAKEWNLEHTHFVNTHGLDKEGHYSTARELGIILEHALQNKNFKKLFTTNKYTSSNKKHTFKSSLSRTSASRKIDSSIILGSKSGYTYDAGLCLASIASDGDYTYLLVTAGADYKANKPYQITDSIAIYEYYFKNYEYKEVLKKDQLLVSIIDENEKMHSFYADKEIKKYLPKKTKIESSFEGVNLLSYDMKEGDKVGSYQIKADGEVIDSIEIYLDKKIEEPKVEKEKKFSWLLCLGILGIFCVFIMIFIKLKYKKKKKKRKA